VLLWLAGDVRSEPSFITCGGRYDSRLQYIIFSLCPAAYNVSLHPLAKFPGPFLRAGFYLPDLLGLARGTSVTDVKGLHDRYGDIVRITPEALSFDTAQAWRGK
jgi:hypothetical protein